MAKNPRLTVIFSAVTDNFNRGIGNVQKRLAKFETSVFRMTKTLLKFSAVGIAGAAAGLTFLVKKQFATLDSIGKLSDRLGIQTEKLLAMRFAAKLAGVEVSSVGKLIEDFATRLGESSRGFGRSQKGFAALRLDARALATSGVGEALLKVSDALERITNKSQRLSILKDVFGERGASAANLLVGSGGLQKALDELKRRGGLFSRGDIFQIEKANDAITRLSESTLAMSRAIAIELAPILTVATQSLDAAFGGDRRSAIQSIVRGSALGIADIADNFSGLFKKIDDGMTAFLAHPLVNFVINGPSLGLGAGFRAPAGEVNDQVALDVFGPRNRILGAIQRADDVLKNFMRENKSEILKGLRAIVPFGLFLPELSNREKLERFFKGVDREIAKVSGAFTVGGVGDAPTSRKQGGLATVLAKIVPQGISGLRTARELGVVGGQQRFSGRGFATEAAKISGLLSQIQRDIAAMRLRQTLGGNAPLFIQ